MMLEKNIQSIMKYKPYMLNLIEELDKEGYRYEGIIKDIFISESVMGEKILGIRMDGRDWYLNSRYDAMKAAKRWVKVCRINDYFGVVVVLGLANLTYIKALREEYPEIHIVIYEPDKYIWNKLLTEIDLEEILADGKLNIVAGQIGELYLMDVLNRVVDYSNYKYMQLMISPNYGKIYEVESLKARKIMFDRIEDIIVERNTMYHFSEQLTLNRYSNLFASLNEYDAGSVKQCFKDINFEKVPAIVVAAGPSLQKNIQELKKAKGKAFIIAVDAAIRALVSENIMPDMTVTIDPNKWLQVLYENEEIKQRPLLTSFDASGGVVDFHEGQKFYFYKPFDIGEMVWEKLNKTYMKVESGGSVANDAFSFVRKIGFKNIILIGQDLAYTDNKVHADTSYGELRNNNATETKKELYKIKDIYGNQVHTDYAMDIYRRWIENQIILHKNMRVIDATEGGALIQGTELMTLKEAIKKLVISDVEVDFVELLKQAPQKYCEEERIRAREIIMNVYTGMTEVKTRLSQAKRDYEKLEALNIKHKYSGSDFRMAIKKVTEQNQWMTTATEVKLLNDYTGRENYEVMEHIYDESDILGQIKAITDGGFKMIKAYQEAVCKFKTDMESVISWFSEMEKYAEDMKMPLERIPQIIENQ